MAGSGVRSLKEGLETGCRSTTTTVYHILQEGYGTPTHGAAPGTLYVKLDATIGTSWLYRRHATSSTTWLAQSDD